ncbi:PH domain-containing protein [Companilactobacillus halodurans]|uniref:PH domain-containing protein n=1 Tax=Companilactobacillus halodurans TaxID=2584183 RepID=A0A5P0ZMG2_9LACO|nr:PH domain-containing protein [Companilactobacillus halodurans]MQS75021.1 PH domain-containing protein [Companilactobacillus halodurans]MQS97872.1 PH domain-containing protein [Companilactobacillus halodurans]
MSILSGLMGNASNFSKEAVRKELGSVLIPDEEIDLAFKWVRNMVIFTNYRLIVVDKQGVTGKKTDYRTLPYKSISRFSVETSGHFDLDAELKIWISSATEPTESLQFTKDNSIDAIQQALAIAILK